MEMESRQAGLADRPPFTRADWLLIGGLAAAKLALHTVNDPAYGFFRDELYYLALAKHLDWGYVDLAPLAAVYAWVAIQLGGALPVVRAIPALAGAVIVVLTMLMARELGGRRYAMGLSGLLVLVAPVYLAVGSFLSMNAMEPLFWTGCAFILIRLARGGDPRLWLVFGALAGLGLENKHSMLLFGSATTVALLLSSQRREFLNPWLWAGGLLAALLILPNLVWQAQHGFPTLEDLRNVQATGKNVVLSPLAYVGRQLLLMHLLLFPFWVAGLWYFLAGRGIRFRVLGWTYVVLLALMIGLKGKDYYLAPIYPMLVAGGAAALEGWLAGVSARWARRTLHIAAPLYIGVAAIPTTILVLPVLAPPAWIQFATAVHFPIPRNETSERSVLPQYLADRVGWEQLVDEVAAVYHALPPEERSRTGIYAQNYGGAGAVNWFGPARGLPPAFSGHQNYFLWGPPEFSGETLIVLETRRERLEPFCREIIVAARHNNPYGMGWENAPIHLCRGFKRPLGEVWPSLKIWI